MSVECLGFPRVKEVVVRGIVVHLFVVFRGRETGEPDGIEIPFRIWRMRVAAASVRFRETDTNCPCRLTDYQAEGLLTC